MVVFGVDFFEIGVVDEAAVAGGGGFEGVVVFVGGFFESEGPGVAAGVLFVDVVEAFLAVGVVGDVGDGEKVVCQIAIWACCGLIVVCGFDAVEFVVFVLVAFGREVGSFPFRRAVCSDKLLIRRWSSGWWSFEPGPLRKVSYRGVLRYCGFIAVSATMEKMGLDLACGFSRNFNGDRGAKSSWPRMARVIIPPPLMLQPSPTQLASSLTRTPPAW